VNKNRWNNTHYCTILKGSTDVFLIHTIRRPAGIYLITVSEIVIGYKHPHLLYFKGFYFKCSAERWLMRFYKELRKPEIK